MGHLHLLNLSGRPAPLRPVATRSLLAFRAVALVYAAALAWLLGSPFDFSWPNAFVWSTPERGIAFVRRTELRTPIAPVRLAEQLEAAPLTIELWAESHRDAQFGPAPIFVYGESFGASANFALAQSGTDLVFWLRGQRSVRVNDALAGPGLRHVALVFDGSELAGFVAGEERVRWPARLRETRWLRDAPLIAASLPSRGSSWRGRFAGVAIYDYALEPDEITSRAAAAPLATAALPAEARVGLVARFDFREGEGSQTADSSGVWPPIVMGSAPTRWLGHLRSGGAFERRANVILFLPLGWMFALSRRWPLAPSVFVSLLLGAAVSVAFESLQYFLPTRRSSALDVWLNVLGAGLGGLLGYATRRGLRDFGFELR